MIQPVLRQRTAENPWTRYLLMSGVLCATAASASALLVSTNGVASRLAHPVRVDAAGGLPESTIAGAVALRVALGIGPWVVLGLIALGHALGRSAPVVARERPGVRECVALVIIVLVGTLLRIVHLDDSFWYDELAGLLGYSIHGPLVVSGNYFSQANHPLGQVLIWFSATLFGVGEIQVRVPAFLAGLATMPAAWLLGRTIRPSGGPPQTELGLLAASAVAIMPIAILASNDARGYAFVILFATVAAWLHLRILREPRASLLTAYAAVLALLVWSHLAAGCVLMAHGVLWLLALRGHDRVAARAGLCALTAGAILALLLHAPLLPDLIERRSAFRTTSPDQPSLWGPETVRAVFAWGGSWTWWAAIPGLLVAALGIVRAFRDRALGTAIVLSGLAVPIAFALAALADSWLYARFLLFGVPAVALAIAAGWSLVGQCGRGSRSAAIALLATVFTAEILRTPPRQPIRDALAIAARPIADRAPRVAALGLTDQVHLYYAQAIGIEVPDLGTSHTDIALQLARFPPDRIVVLYPDFRPDERLAPLRNAGFTPTTSLPGWIDWGKGRIEVWSRE